MKFKLLTSLVVAATVVSCNNKKEDAQTKETPQAPEKAKVPAAPEKAKIPVAPEVPVAPEKPKAPVVEVDQPSVVSGALAELVQKFDGEKYVSTQLDHSADYFIVYNTASW